MLSSEPPRHNDKKKKLDPSLLAAASYRDLAHWVAILDLDPNRLNASDDFQRWIERCDREVRAMDEGGFVVRGESGSFLFIDQTTNDLCDKQLEELKPYWLNPTDDAS